MIEIGEMPILLHIMNIYAHYGYNEFIVCLGYKGYVIKEFFANYYRHMSKAITFDFSSGDAVEVHHNTVQPWKVTLVDTGLDTMTGSRVKRIEPYIEDQPFMLTYGDGLSNVNIKQLVSHHKQGGKLATITAVQPEGRFGQLELQKDQVIGFNEKVKGDGAWINGGFMVCEPKMLSYITDLNDTILEQGPLQQLAADGQLQVYRHHDFWQPMDSLREKIVLEEMWKNNKAPWKIWSS